MAPLEDTAALLSSRSSAGGGDKVGIELRFGGRWEHQADGTVKYVGGQRYWEKVPARSDYAELMHRMSAKVNGAVTLKYAPPGEEIIDPENLVTVVDNDHVQEMFEEYWNAAGQRSQPGKTFRLQIWLVNAAEEDVTPEELEFSRSSNHSSSSAGIDHSHRRHSHSPHAHHHHDVEMQEREAEEMVTWIHDQEEINAANWQAHLARNLARAQECTYDSFGWPRDRSPMLRAMQHAEHKHAQSFQLPGTSVYGGNRGWAGWGQQGQQVLPPEQLQEEEEEEQQPPMIDLTFLTQDPYKEDLAVGSRRMEVEASGEQGRARHAYFLPSQLGSEVGNAPLGTLEAAEKAHMDLVVAGMVEHALGEPPQPSPLPGPGAPPAGSAQMHAGGSQYGADPLGFRSASRLSHHSIVNNIPQADIHVVRGIGEGTFGEVVLASNEVFGYVAVKWLKPAKMDKHKDKFWEEACMLAALNHPNVLRFYGIVTAGRADQSVVGIMTEFMHGSSLSNYLRSGSPRIPLVQRAELARGAVNGLAYLHAMNIVHFDLKPDNLLLDRQLIAGHETPGVKVADFGLSKQKFSKYVSGVRDLRGTLPYMAPELVSDPDHVTEAADVWSLGVVLWEMLTMETPYQSHTPQDIIHGLMVGRRPELPEDCEPEWFELMDGCMRAQPAQRLKLREVAARLDAIIASAPPPAPGTPY